MGEVKQTQMIFKSSIVTEFKNSKISSVDTVPIGNVKATKILFADGDKNEFISTTRFGEDFPAQLDPWTQIVLTKEWATSFAEKVNEVPKPLFIPGHADTGVGAKERAIPDGYLTGAIVLGEILYLRNSLPEGDTEHQKALISQTLKEINAGMLSTSLTDVMEYNIVVDEIEDTYMYFATKSLKGQTNALVEQDQTASEAEIIITSFKADNDSSGEKEEGEKRMGEKTTTNAEHFIVLKNQLESGHLALATVAEGLGIDLMTAKQKVALKRLNDAESKVGNIEEFVASVTTEKEVAFASLKEAKIKEIFKDESLIEIATPMFALKNGSVEDIDKEVLRISELKVFKSIQGNIASAMNYNPGTGETEEVTESNETMEG